MRRGVLVAVVLVVCLGRAGAAPDPMDQAVTWLADPDPAVRARAFDVLVLRAEPAQLSDDVRPGASAEVRAALHGVRYLVVMATRLAAFAPDAAGRYFVLDEVLRSPWAAHADAWLARAGLFPKDAARLLAQRAAAREAFEAYQVAAWGTMANDPSKEVDAIAKVGPSVLPHLVLPLANPPWLANQGWPTGPTVIRQRMSVWALKRMQARAAVPYLLLHVDAPSGTLQWDALDALATITGDASWKIDDLGDMERLRELRATWWKQHGAPYSGATRSLAIDALRNATDFLVSLRADPKHWRKAAWDGAPDPLLHLYEVLALLGVVREGLLPPPVTSVLDYDAAQWLPRIGRQLQRLEASP